MSDDELRAIQRDTDRLMDDLRRRFEGDRLFRPLLPSVPKPMTACSVRVLLGTR